MNDHGVGTSKLQSMYLMLLRVTTDAGDMTELLIKEAKSSSKVKHRDTIC